MWKKYESIAIIFLLLSGCSFLKRETIFQPYIEQYLTVFIEENEKLNQSDHLIVVNTKLVSDQEYILGIGSEVNNIYFYKHENDTIYSCNYKGYEVLVLGEKNILLEEVSEKNRFIPLSSDEYAPVQYDRIFWELRIKSQKLIDFKYQFCEPDAEVFKRLKSIASLNI